MRRASDDSFLFLFIIEVHLIYNVVLVSGLQQSDSYTYTFIYIYVCVHIYRASQVALVVKNPCQCRRHEMGVRCLGQEDPLEKEMTTHSSILAWRIPWTEEPEGLQSMESQRVGRN